MGGKREIELVSGKTTSSTESMIFYLANNQDIKLIISIEIINI